MTEILSFSYWMADWIAAARRSSNTCRRHSGT